MTPNLARHPSRLAVRKARTSVMSTSTPSVTCGAPVQWALSRCAVTRRMPASGITSCGGSPDTLLSSAGSSAAFSSGAGAVPASIARLTSSLVTRPPGPVPSSRSASTPWRSANRRATGVTLCSPDTACGATIVSSDGSGSASPASPIHASVAPTGYSRFTGASMRSSTPPAGASTSTTALSVSTANSGAPSTTSAPSATYHSTTLPRSMVWPSAASLSRTAIRPSPGAPQRRSNRCRAR